MRTNFIWSFCRLGEGRKEKARIFVGLNKDVLGMMGESGMGMGLDYFLWRLLTDCLVV